MVVYTICLESSQVFSLVSMSFGILAAIANAVYDATGVRVKELPIYPYKIIGGLLHEK
jgi:hypothetical protein